MPEIRVADVMTESVIVAREGDDVTDVLKRMRSFGVRRVPVIDDKGALCGIIAFDDVLDFLREQVTDMASIVAREREHELIPV